MHKYFNPRIFTRYGEAIFPYVVLASLGLLAMGIYYALFNSPVDYQQGEFVRIMYVHVPSAWMALGCYSFMATASAAYLIWKNPLSSVMTAAAAPVGACFTVICLVTGSLWGKPIWGTWWVWDARLTSVLILLFFYIGYICLYGAIEDRQRAAKSCSILCLLGFVNIPVIKFSVEWWNTLHQPASIMRRGGVAIDDSMLVPLLLMFCAFICLFLVILIIRVKSEITLYKIERKLNQRTAN